MDLGESCTLTKCNYATGPLSHPYVLELHSCTYSNWPSSNHRKNSNWPPTNLREKFFYLISLSSCIYVKLLSVVRSSRYGGSFSRFFFQTMLNSVKTFYFPLLFFPLAISWKRRKEERERIYWRESSFYPTWDDQCDLCVSFFLVGKVATQSPTNMWLLAIVTNGYGVCVSSLLSYQNFRNLIFEW